MEEVAPVTVSDAARLAPEEIEVSCSFYTVEPPYQDDIIKWKLFPRYWPFVQGIHRSPVNSPHKGPVMWTLMWVCISC